MALLYGLVSLILLLGTILGKGTLDINTMIIASGLFAIAAAVQENK